MPRRRRSHKREGTAMVESAIMLPVLGVLLVGTLFVEQRYRQAPLARAEARRCAMLHARAGCGSPVPSGCEAWIDGARQARGGGSSLLAAAETAAGTPLELAQLPGLSDAIDELFGRTKQASVEWELAWPGSDTAHARGVASYGLLCDQGETTPAQVAERTFCHATELCP